MKIKRNSKDSVFFTSDEHYHHRNAIKYSNRPFYSVEEMNESMIQNHNNIVPKHGFTIHAGDFCFGDRRTAQEIISRLNGEHFFLMGSHDSWLSPHTSHEIVEITVDRQTIVVCHYAMRVWAKSHYGSWHLYGHSHGKLQPEGKSWDIGVDNNSYKPLSWSDVESIMSTRPDNFNLISQNKRKY